MPVLYHVLERRAATWIVVCFQAWGPPVGPVVRVYQPASLDKPVDSGSSAVLLRASQTFSQSGPTESQKEREREREEM